MRKKIFSKIIFIFAVLLFASCATEVKYIKQKMMKATVRFEAIYPNKQGKSICTAWAVDRIGKSYHFSLAAHCLPDICTTSSNTPSFWVILEKDNGKVFKYYKSNVVAMGTTDDFQDLAIVRAELDEYIPILPLGYRAPNLDEELRIVSAPIPRLGNQMFRAYISKEKSDKIWRSNSKYKWKGIIPIQAKELGVGFGSSGGAVVSLEQKAVVAVIVASMENPNTRHVTILTLPVSRFKKFYKEVKKGKHKWHKKPEDKSQKDQCTVATSSTSSTSPPISH